MLAVKIIITIVLAIPTLFCGIRGLYEFLLWTGLAPQNTLNGSCVTIQHIMERCFFVSGEYHRGFPVFDIIIFLLNVAILVFIW